MRQVLLYPGNDGYYVAEVPSLPGAVSQGKTREEAITNIREAITLIEDVLAEHGDPVPAETFDALLVAV